MCTSPIFVRPHDHYGAHYNGVSLGTEICSGHTPNALREGENVTFFISYCEWIDFINQNIYLKTSKFNSQAVGIEI